MMMQFRTQMIGWHDAVSFGEIVAALVQLGWRKAEDHSLILENKPRGFAQTCHYRPGLFFVEWRGSGDLLRPEQSLFRARIPGPLGRLRCKGNISRGQYPLYHADLLSLPQVVDILQAFWLRRARPTCFAWASMEEIMAQQRAAVNPHRHN